MSLTFRSIQEVDSRRQKTAHGVARQPGGPAREDGTCTPICEVEAFLLSMEFRSKHRTDDMSPDASTQGRFAMFFEREALVAASATSC